MEQKNRLVTSTLIMEMNLPAPVDKVIGDYLSGIKLIDDELVEGVYLTGSVALGDYYSKKSDIDFITLLRKNPSHDTLTSLKRLHHKIERRYHYPRFNGYYLTLSAIQSGQRFFPSFFKNKMYSSREFELDKITLLEWKSALNVHGPPPTELPLNIDLKDVLKQLHHNINNYWSKWIRKYSSPGLDYFFLWIFPRLTEWGVLGVARQVYTLETGKITSKLNAGNYCLSKMPEHLQPVMISALSARKTNSLEAKPSLRRARETIECMIFLTEHFNELYEQIAASLNKD